MSTAETVSRFASSADVPVHDLFRLSVPQYHRMFETGILKEDDRCELLGGCIVTRLPMNPPHAQAVRRLFRLLNAQLTEEWLVNSRLPITLEITDREPIPDMTVVRGPDTRYDNRHPGPADSEIVIEVADSSLVRDRTVKLAICAAAKIPQYWIVNLPERRVEVYTRPRGGKSPQYRTRTDYPAEATLPVILAGKTLGTIAINAILP